MINFFSKTGPICISITGGYDRRDGYGGDRGGYGGDRRGGGGRMGGGGGDGEFGGYRNDRRQQQYPREEFKEADPG